MVETPKGNRLHIGIFGRVNSGKSSLINALTGQELAVVSAVPGTTTDPVKKAVELRGIGPCLLIDRRLRGRGGAGRPAAGKNQRGRQRGGYGPAGGERHGKAR